MRWFFFLLPWIELWSLIELGSSTSALFAIGWVFLTLMAGVSLIRAQGMQMLRELQRRSGGQMFGPQLLVDDLALVSAGLLLVVPGLVTDTLAVLFLFAALGRRLLRAMRGGNAAAGPADLDSEQFRSEPGPDKSAVDAEHVTLEGDYRRLDD
jgi:UPF0716 protein FxsA